MIIRKTPAEIDRIARAGALSAATIAHVAEHLRPGITTSELDAIAGEFIRSQGGVSTSKGYKGYPAEICISPNDVVVHGIPGGHLVEDGDVITLDVGVTLDGFIADSAFTFGVGALDSETERLLAVGRDALASGIEHAQLGNRVGDISNAVQFLLGGKDLGNFYIGNDAITTRIHTSRTSACPAADRASRRA